jgi:hypothetical protein
MPSDQHALVIEYWLRFFLEMRIALIFLRKVEKENPESSWDLKASYDDQRSMFHMALPVC